MSDPTEATSVADYVIVDRNLAGMLRQQSSIREKRAVAIVAPLVGIILIAAFLYFGSDRVAVVLIPIIIGLPIMVTAHAIAMYLHLRNDLPLIAEDIASQSFETVHGLVDYAPQGGMLKLALVEIGDRFYRTAIFRDLQIPRRTVVTAVIGKRSRYISRIMNSAGGDLVIPLSPQVRTARMNLILIFGSLGLGMLSQFVAPGLKMIMLGLSICLSLSVIVVLARNAYRKVET